MINSQAAIHECKLVRYSLRNPRFSQSNVNNFKCNSAQQLFIAGRRSAEKLSTIGVENLELPLPPNSLGLQLTQRQQDEILN